MDREGKIEAKRFDLDLSMKCGQIFGWHEEGGTYYSIIDSKAVALRQWRGQIFYEAAGSISPGRIRRYLGLDEDLGAILSAIRVDSFMRKVTKRVRNLRLFKQDPWSCLCAYIISANNRVDRIDAIYKRIACQLGESLRIGSKAIYSFPSPQRLLSCSESSVRACGAGFRAPYILEAARMVCEGRVDLAHLGTLPYVEARELLKTIPGVGDKVADCVLLFAYSKYEAFPVDVWIKRAVERVYFNSRSITKKGIREFGQAYFGRYAGYAQEYIYTYARLYGL